MVVVQPAETVAIGPGDFDYVVNEFLACSCSDGDGNPGRYVVAVRQRDRRGAEPHTFELVGVVRC